MTYEERAEKIARWYEPAPSKLMVLNIAAEIRQAVEETQEDRALAKETK